jgi:two-component system sensor histidine kinase/response regulator
LREMEKGTGQHQAVVAMTALVMKGDRERCIAAGMDGYLSKPIRPQELDEVLDSYVARERVDYPVEEPSGLLEASVCAEELLERIDGDRTFLSELLELFRADYPGQIRTAREAVSNGDAAALQLVGHALKGALQNLAAPIASKLAAGLESMGRSGDIALAEPRVKELEKELPRVIETLEALCLEVAK